MNLFRLMLTEVQLRTDMLIFSASNWSNCLPQLQNEFCYACQKQTNAVNCPFLNCLQSMSLFGFEVNTGSHKNISFYFFLWETEHHCISTIGIAFLTHLRPCNLSSFHHNLWFRTKQSWIPQHQICQLSNLKIISRAISTLDTSLTLNPSHLNIRMHILHTVPHTFPMVLTGRICFTIIGDCFLYSYDPNIFPPWENILGRKQKLFARRSFTG